MLRFTLTASAGFVKTVKAHSVMDAAIAAFPEFEGLMIVEGSVEQSGWTVKVLNTRTSRKRLLAGVVLEQDL